MLLRTSAAEWQQDTDRSNVATFSLQRLSFFDGFLEPFLIRPMTMRGTHIIVDLQPQSLASHRLLSFLSTVIRIHSFSIYTIIS